MTYTVNNPTEQPIIMSAFEGQTYTVPPGESIEVENERAALTLADYGAVLSSQDRKAAIEVEGDRTPEERLAAVEARTGEEKGVTTAADLDPGELKGAALDDALRAAGLPVKGKVDEKRAALAEHRASGDLVVVDEHDGGEEKIVATEDGEPATEQTGSPATPGGTVVEGVSAPGDVAPFDEQNAPVVLPAVPVDEAPARD